MVMESAGILLFRRRKTGREVFLVHMGGPLWAKKDQAAWSIPKGLIGPKEDPLGAACREFTEETGFTAAPPFIPLGRFRQNSSKYLTVWAAQGDADPDKLVSSLFTMVWPPRSGQAREFPEADRGGWFGRAEAAEKIVKGQLAVLEHFFSRNGAARRD